MAFLYALEGIRNPFLDTVMGLVTELGGEVVYLALAIVVFWCVDKYLGYYIMTAGFVGTLFNQFLKITCRIPRPWVLDPNYTIVESAREAATGYSFPSGHTQNIFSTFGVMGVWTKKLWFRIVCGAVVVLVAFSRMYVGVHTPLDVGVAFIMGLVLVFALYPLFRNMSEHPERMYWVLGGMIVMCVAYLLYVEMWAFPADIDAHNMESAVKNGYQLLGALAAMVVSFWADRRYIKFSVKAGIPAQIVKVAVGLGVTVGLRAVLKAPLLSLFNGADLAHAVRYFIVIIFAAGVWPMTFKWFASWGEKAKEK